jgi:spermidine synthase
VLNSYRTILIGLIIIGLYSFTWILTKFKKIKLANHRKLWNILLLVSFLVSGILGLILAIFIDYKISIAWYRSFLWLHVEFGIVMGAIAVFHFFWHIKYYLRIFARKESIKKEILKEETVTYSKSIEVEVIK